MMVDMSFVIVDVSILSAKPLARDNDFFARSPQNALYQTIEWNFDAKLLSNIN